MRPELELEEDMAREARWQHVAEANGYRCLCGYYGVLQSVEILCIPAI
jgi:hypothetical protein